MLFFVRAYQDDLEVADVSGRPEHCPSDPGRRRHVEAWGNGNAVLVAVDRVPHQGLVVLPEQDEHEAMAAVEEPVAVAVVELQREAPDGDTVGGLQSWYEGDPAGRNHFLKEEAEEGRVAAVMAAESAEESGVRDEATPALADERGAREGGGLRGEAEEDLGQQIFVVQRRRRRRRAGRAAEAAHLALLTDAGVFFFFFFF